MCICRLSNMIVMYIFIRNREDQMLRLWNVVVQIRGLFYRRWYGRSTTAHTRPRFLYSTSMWLEDLLFRSRCLQSQVLLDLNYMNGWKPLESDVSFRKSFLLWTFHDWSHWQKNFSHHNVHDSQHWTGKMFSEKIFAPGIPKGTRTKAITSAVYARNNHVMFILFVGMVSLLNDCVIHRVAVAASFFCFISLVREREQASSPGNSQ